jgi:hypothetical protein
MSDPRMMDRSAPEGYQRAPGHAEPGVGTPPPDPVTESIRAELLARQRVGWRKYGVGLGRPDFSVKDWIHHLYEELLDAAQYSKRLMMTIEGQLIVVASVTRWRHVKRQTTYLELGRGSLESPAEEGDILVAYRSEADGKLYFRRDTNFDDGRFEKMEPLFSPAQELTRAQEMDRLNREIGERTARLQFLAFGDPREK